MEPITVVYRYRNESFTVKSYHVPQPGDSVSLRDHGSYIVVYRNWIIEDTTTKVIIRLDGGRP